MIWVLLVPPISSAFGEEPLLVRVLSVDQVSGKISGEVLGGPLWESDTMKTDSFSNDQEGAREEKTTKIMISMASGSLPEGLRPGEVVRVWGGFSGGTQIFSAQKLSSAVTGRKNDPTGVRRRLGKGRGMLGTRGSARGHGRK